MWHVEKWNHNRACYRSFSGKTYDHRLSCGFLNKAGISIDIENERYDRLAMVYLLRGRGRYEDSKGIRSALNPGDIFFRCPDRTHSTFISPDSQWLECFVSVRTEWFHLLRDIGLMLPESPVLHFGLHSEIPERIDTLMQQLIRSDTPLSNSDHEFEIVALMRQVLRRNLEPNSGSSRQQLQLERARAQIRSRATESIDLETILNTSGLSYSRIRSLFREIYGISPGDYRIQVRMEQACALLETTHQSVQQIADHLGYPDAFTFSKQFKQRIGLAPDHFRKRL